MTILASRCGSNTATDRRERVALAIRRIRPVILIAPLVSAFAVLVPLSAQPPPPAPPELQQQLTAAQKALDTGHPLEAERLFRQILDTQSRWVEAHRGLANALAKQGRRTEALQVLLPMGESLFWTGRTEPAVSVLQQAVELAPEEAAAHAWLGRALCFEKRFGEAVPHLEKALAGDATDRLKLQFYLASALWESNRLADAEAVFRTAIDDSGGDFIPLHQLGRLLLWQGKALEAVPWLRRAAVLRPGSADAKLDLARALEEAGELDAAISAYRSAVALAPDRSPPRYGLAQALIRRSEAAEGQQELEIYRQLFAAEQAESRWRRRQRARLDRGWELLQQGLPEQAADQFASMPETGDSLIGLATAQSAAGNFAAAVVALERAVTLDPERQDLTLRLMEARLAARDRPQVVDE